MVIINASMFCELTENIMIEATSQSDRTLHQMDQSSSKLARYYEKTRITNSSNVKLRISTIEAVTIVTRQSFRNVMRGC
jgi:hypothetical protein